MSEGFDHIGYTDAKSIPATACNLEPRAEMYDSDHAFYGPDHGVRTMTLLGVLGLIPFLVPPWLVYSDVTLPGLDAVHLFLGYSAVILSFLGGTLWGRAIAMGLTGTARMLLLSNLIALSAWVALLLGTPQAAIGLLLVGFLFTYAVEWRGAHTLGASALPGYGILRTGLTSVVVVLHLVMLAVLP